MRKIIYLFFLAIIGGNNFISNAQDLNSCNCDTLLTKITEPKLIGDLFQQQQIGVGSQYYIGDWLKGDVLLDNNYVVKNKNLRYNAFFDRLIWLTPESFQQVKLDPGLVQGFSLTTKLGSTISFKKIKIKDEVRITSDSVFIYAQVLLESNVSLFAHRKIEITGNEIAQGGTHFLDVYTLKNIYYFKFSNGKTIGFKRFRKHDIIKMFPDKKEIIKGKLKEAGQHRFNTEADLVNVTRVLSDIL
jgi:hypothetical protein